MAHITSTSKNKNIAQNRGSSPSSTLPPTSRRLDNRGYYRRRRFINLGRYTSEDKESPDVLSVIPQTDTIYPTEYSQCTDVALEENGSWVDVVLPLRSHNSKNPALLNLWTEGKQNGTLQIGRPITILTWRDKSKNGFPIRRFRIVI